MLISIIKLFKEIYKEKQKNKNNKPGKPKKYTDIQIALICIIMLLKQIYTFKGIIRYLHNDKKLCHVIGLSEVPDRTTLSRRAKKIHKKLREIIQCFGEYYCNLMDSTLLFAAEDASLFRAQGPVWHKKYMKQGITPRNLRNVDREAKWGFSPTKRFVYGYKSHINVVSDFKLELPPFPIDAVVTTANVSDNKKAKTLHSNLADNVKFQFADKGYDSVKSFIELWSKGIIFVTPIKKNKKMDSITFMRWFWHQLLKNASMNKRGVTIEPFNGRIKDLFHIDPLLGKGKKKAKIFISSSIICYQLIVIYNINHHRKIGAVKEILDLI